MHNRWHPDIEPTHRVKPGEEACLQPDLAKIDAGPKLCLDGLLVVTGGFDLDHV